MLTETVSRRSGATPRLILIFAGWGMDSRPFASLARDGYDIAVVWDYADPSPISDAFLVAYKEICVLGWSFGVPYAARFTAANEERLPITRCVAVNGTLHPVDDRRGIPRDIFEGTLAALSERTLDKFRRRMAGSADAYKRFIWHAPERSADSLAEELRRVDADGPAPDPVFDAVYIAGQDRIIPADNQIEAWGVSDGVIIHEDEPHLPDFQAIIDAEFRNKELVGRSFGAHGGTYDSHAGIQALAAEELARRFGLYLRSRQPVVEFGVGTGILAQKLGISPSRMRLYDLAPLSPEVRQADAEIEIARMTAAEPRGIAGVISASTIQWFNSPQRFILRALRALRPGKILALSTFTPSTYEELIPYQSSRPAYMSEEALTALARELEAEGMIHSGWTVRAMRPIVVKFRDTREMIAHIRATGVNATQAPDIAAARALIRSGLASLTYQPLFFVAVKA